MPLFPDLILLLSPAIIIVIYLLIKIVNGRSSYKKRKNELLDLFQQQRLKSKKLQDELSNYILTNNAHKTICFENATCGDYLKQLQKNHLQNLSDKIYLRIKNSNNRILLMKTAEELKIQEIKLNEAEIRIAGIQDSNSAEKTA